MSNRAERRRADKLAAKGKRPESYTYRQNSVAFRRESELKVKPYVSDERLVSCAITHEDGTIDKGFKSHWELRASLNYEDPSRFNRGDVPGFWTSWERFVDREEAMHIAFDAGQIRQTQQREFLSSDVDTW